MRKFTIVMLLIAGFAFVSKSQGIQFHHDISLEEAMKKAKQENKLIFIDAYTTWCGPCTYLSKNIFTQKSVGDYYNKNFINVKVNMEKAPVGSQVNAKFNIRAYPTLLFINSSGKLVHKVEGAGDANYVVALGKKAISKGGSTSNVSQSQGIKFHHDISLDEAFSKAKRENKLIFIDAYTTWCGPCKYLSKNIFTQQSVGDYYNKNFINVKINMEKVPVGPRVDAKYNIRAYPTLLFVNSSGKLVHKVEGAGDANFVLNLGKKAIEKGGSSTTNNTGAVESAYSAAFKYVSTNKTNSNVWNDYVKKATAYFNSGKASSMDMNNGSWFIYENYRTFNDATALKLAKTWSKKSIDIEPNSAFNYDTYAHILFDLGYTNDAIKYEELAIKKAVMNNDKPSDITFYKTELSKFKSSLN